MSNSSGFSSAYFLKSIKYDAESGSNINSNEKDHDTN